MEGIERLRILDVPVDVLTMEQAIDVVSEMAKDHSRTKQVVSISPRKIKALLGDPELRDFTENADLIIPDGYGMVAAAKILYKRKFERVAGADLMQRICAESGKRGVKIFIFGTKEKDNAGAVEILRQRYPDTLIVGRHNGYVKDDEMEALVQEINISGADIVFVALVRPKQEQWMKKYGPQLNAGVCMGCGGTLDTITGTKKRAPLMWQKLNLEWLYYVIHQPKRLCSDGYMFWFAIKVVFKKFQMLSKRIFVG